MQTADDARTAAQALLGLSLWNDAVSRAYYASSHYVLALLLTIELEPRTHQGTQHLFHQHFVRTGAISAELGKQFTQLQRYRELADYSREQRITEELARSEVANAETICVAIRAHLATGSWLS